MSKILIIRFSSIGDMVLTTPVVRCIKQQVQQAEVHYLTKASFASIMRNNPYVDKTYGMDGDLRKVLPLLRRERYDYIIDLHHNLRSLFVKMALRRPSSSFRKLNYEKWLMVNRKMDHLPRVHVVDRYMETAGKLGVKNDGKGLDYFIPVEEEVHLASLPPAFQKGYVALVVGARHFTKQLPSEKIMSICKKINKPVLLLGGKEDEEKGKAIEAAAENAYSVCGKYTLNQSASLIRQAEKVITPDTGLMHIAAAFKKEIISVWGNTIPEFGMYPYYGEASVKNAVLEVKPLSCRPCSKIGYAACPKGHFKCMKLIHEKLFIG